MEGVIAVSTLILLGILIFQLSTGKLLGRYLFFVRTTSKERPAYYWSYIEWQCFLLLLGTWHSLNAYFKGRH